MDPLFHTGKTYASTSRMRSARFGRRIDWSQPGRWILRPGLRVTDSYYCVINTNQYTWRFSVVLPRRSGYHCWEQEWRSMKQVRWPYCRVPSDHLIQHQLQSTVFEVSASWPPSAQSDGDTVWDVTEHTYCTLVNTVASYFIWVISHFRLVFESIQPLNIAMLWCYFPFCFLFVFLIA